MPIWFLPPTTTPTSDQIADTSSCQTVVQAFISCRLDHCNSLLYGISENLMRRVQSVQNAAARLLTGARRRDHISPVLRRLQWLAVRSRIDFKLACLVHLSLAGQAPHYLAEDIHLVAASPGRQLRSSTDTGRAVSHVRTARRRQKLCRSRDSCVEQSAIEFTQRKTQFSELQAPAENSLVYSDHSAMRTFIYCAIEIHLLTYLLTTILL